MSEQSGAISTGGRLAGAAAVVALLLTLAFAGSAGAATYAPNTTADGPADAGDCPPAPATPAEGACSLRDAVAAANQSEANDEIVLEGKRYELDPDVDRGLEIREATPAGTLLIRGTSARETIVDGNATSEQIIRTVTFEPGAESELRDLAVTGGNGNNCGECSGDGTGGGILVQDSSFRSSSVDAEALLTRVRVFGNGADFDGGGIANDGKLTLVQSLVDDNVAGGSGGGIENDDELTLTNSTVSGNRALGAPPSQGPLLSEQFEDDEGNGGGIDNDGDSAEFFNGTTELAAEPIPADAPFLRAENSTIAYNEAEGNGGGVSTALSSGCAGLRSVGGCQAGEPQAYARFHNAIVSDNAADGDTNCSGNQPAGSGDETSSEGHNLEDGDSCQFTASGDLDAKSGLGALADNGGGTDTHALAAGSAAIDAAEAEGCPAVDQRGTSRPQGSACDIGAFERTVPKADEPPQQQPAPQQQTPAAEGPRCLDSRPPITELKREGLTVTRRTVRLSGTSRDEGAPCASGVHRVEVSMAKISGTDLHCRFIRRSSRFLLSPLVNCRQPIRFLATGTSQWAFRFRVKLAPGKYRAQARGYDEARNKETPRRRVNIVAFTVK